MARPAASWVRGQPPRAGRGHGRLAGDEPARRGDRPVGQHHVQLASVADRALGPEPDRRPAAWRHADVGARLPALPLGRGPVDVASLGAAGTAGGRMSAPLSYLHGDGAQSAWVTPLLLFMLFLSILVILIISALVVAGAWRAKGNGGAAETRAVPLATGRGGVRWIGIGIAISTVPLLVSLVWTIVALAHVGTVPRNPRLTIEVTARQWWWDATYDGPPSDHIFRTANEIHIPVGEPVLLRLHSSDVI